LGFSQRDEIMKKILIIFLSIIIVSSLILENESPIDHDKPPVIYSLGFNIEHWNKETNRAGDFLFKEGMDKIFDGRDKIFGEYGESIINEQGRKIS
jgi:hypothetical protein